MPHLKDLNIGMGEMGFLTSVVVGLQVLRVRSARTEAHPMPPLAFVLQTFLGMM